MHVSILITPYTRSGNPKGSMLERAQYDIVLGEDGRIIKDRNGMLTDRQAIEIILILHEEG